MADRENLKGQPVDTRLSDRGKEGFRVNKIRLKEAFEKIKPEMPLILPFH